ncbi:MAG TPA: hypothetical protein DDW42_06225, partial [Desulfobacteraceae bacterium]|nr:hypothetical protein [Desulfobacteraceae bacterium]
LNVGYCYVSGRFGLAALPSKFSLGLATKQFSDSLPVAAFIREAENAEMEERKNEFFAILGSQAKQTETDKLFFQEFICYLNPNVAKVEDAPDLRRQG